MEEKQMLKAVHGKDVHMLPGLFQKRMKLNEDYLMELDPACLLQNFYLEAGIIPEGCQVLPDPEKAKMHWPAAGPFPRPLAVGSRRAVLRRKETRAESPGGPYRG